ncbi:hypothetical protein V7S43_017125 [Phytophthora oleae]|uniref:3'-5' exonuclease domain-containing protein n=1 Tax=Phytophthora oleae TaxID=2107226 RepID=A0ABD3EX80_9STRA
MELFTAELVEIFHSCRDAVQCANDIPSWAEQWTRGIHRAFYSATSTRGSNKFVALESALTDVFTHLNRGETAQFFWDFVVQVLLALAQEPAVEQAIATEKKSSKKCQPNAPLAFLVANALRKITSGDADSNQTELCRLQGRNNDELRNFCLKGLGHSSDIDQKLLVELLGLFQINDINRGLVRNAMDPLLASKSHAALIKLCEAFSDVDWPFDAIVTRMVQTKDWTSAEFLVRTFEVDNESALAKALIDETISLRDFKRAHRFVSTFNLQREYPDVDVLYSRDGLMRLIETQRWQLALTFVGHDSTLQKVLLEHMVAAAERAHATQLAKKMVAAGFDADISLMIQNCTDSSEINAILDNQQCEDGNFLSLSKEDQNIVFCDSRDKIKGAMDHFFESENGASQVVGLDVEWKPITSRLKAVAAVASILQIASSERVFIIDLLTLHDNDFLFDNFLHRLLTSPHWLKLGFSFDSDLKVLHQTFPERQAFAAVTPFLDLNSLDLKSGKSLSQCVLHVLGKPLDKRMQLSDWNQRPLSSDQLKYAALDALCLVQVVDKLRTQDNSGLGLPCWDDVAKRIDKLDHANSFSKAEELEAISHRTEYQRKWLLERATGDESQCETLVAPRDIQRIWEDRASSLKDVSFDTALKFLPMDQITAMREDADPHDFITVNSICVFVDETPAVVCVDASCKLDVARFARFCGVGRRRVRLATAPECRNVFGFSPGTVAPFGHKPWPSSSDEKPVRIKLYADSRLHSAQYLAAGSGSHDKVLWVTSKAFFALISITLVDDVSIPRGPSRYGSDADLSDVSSAEEAKVLEYKFLADSMVTQVGRWLRTIGVDVVAWNPNELKAARSKDPKSVMLAYAAEEDRIVLTRDTGLPGRRDAGACFVLSDDECHKQFREVKLQFGLLEQLDTRSSRCARCNSDAFSPIDAVPARKKMSERLRKKVPASVSTFWNCDGCGRVYWEGPKYTPDVSSDANQSPDGRVVYRPVPRKRVAGDPDTRHRQDLKNVP